MKTAFFDELGPRGRRNVNIVTAGFLFLLAGVVLLSLRALHEKGQLDPQIWAVLLDPDLASLLLEGLIATLEAALAALLLSMSGGALMSIALLSLRRSVSFISKAVADLLRGLPPLLMIFFIYLGGPSLGVEISLFWSLVIGITLYNIPIIAEVFRTGVSSISRGQREAGYAIGLDEMQTLRLILFPQAIRRMLPILVSQSVVLLKETSLGFVIGYQELLREGRTAVEFLGGQYSLPVYTLLALIYITCNLALGFAAKKLEGYYNA